MRDKEPALCYIYLPGLGDRFDPLRRFLLRRWKSATLIPMIWSSEEGLQQKYTRILEVIRRLDKSTVVLVGESAGATIAITLLSRHPELISRVVTVSGFNHGSEAILPSRRRRNPALYEASQRAEASFEHMPKGSRERITTVYSVFDCVVGAKYSRLEGVAERILYTPGHMASIGYILLRGL